MLPNTPTTASPTFAMVPDATGTPLAAAMAVQRQDVSTMHEEAMTIYRAIDQNKIKPKEVMNFLKNVEHTNPTNAQQMKADCMACSRSVTSTGAAKFVIHIVGCPLMPRDIRAAFGRLRDQAGRKAAAKQDATVLAEEESQIHKRQHDVEQAVLKQQCIRAGLKTSEVAAADLAIANFFYSNAIGFSAACNDEHSLYREMVRAIQKTPAGYVPPNRHKLAGPLLDEGYKSMWQKANARDPDGSLTEKYGSCYVSDGWDSCDHLPLINSAFITANDGGLYWRSVDTSGKTKSSEYCAMLMILDIYAYGPAKVVLVITDTCNTMVKAWALVQDEFPWISVLCCQPHVIALLLKGIPSTRHTRILNYVHLLLELYMYHPTFPVPCCHALLLRY